MIKGQKKHINDYLNEYFLEKNLDDFPSISGIETSHEGKASRDMKECSSVYWTTVTVEMESRSIAP